jgi:uncharacterized membrane protein YqaE (UPF0057 family)
MPPPANTKKKGVFKRTIIVNILLLFATFVVACTLGSYTQKRYVSEPNQTIKSLMKQKIKKMIHKKSEYSGMIKSILAAKGVVVEDSN